MQKQQSHDVKERTNVHFSREERTNVTSVRRESCEVLSFDCANGTGRETVSAMKAMLLFDDERNAVRFNAVLRADRRTASAADAGFRNEVSFRFLCRSPGGARTTVREEKNGWGRILWKKEPGWISLEYVKRID